MFKHVIILFLIGIILCLLYLFYYAHKKIRKSIFNYINQYSKKNCYIKLLDSTITIQLHDDDMYLLSKNFRERCYQKSYKNSNILISDNEISFVNNDINLNDFDLNISDQHVKKGEVYYKDNNGKNLSIALIDHDSKCLIIGNTSDGELKDIQLNKNNYIVDMGIN